MLERRSRVSLLGPTRADSDGNPEARGCSHPPIDMGAQLAGAAGVALNYEPEHVRLAVVDCILLEHLHEGPTQTETMAEANVVKPM